MKRMIATCMAALMICVLLAACGQHQNKKGTVKLVNPTDEEQTYANLFDGAYKFSVASDEVYDISLYFWHDGVLDNPKTFYGVKGVGADNVILIAMQSGSGRAMHWSLGADPSCYRASFGHEADGETSEGVGTSGPGCMKFDIEANKEYVLAYNIGVDGDAIDGRIVEPFERWDTVEDKEAALKPFAYAHFATISLNATSPNFASENDTAAIH